MNYNLIIQDEGYIYENDNGDLICIDKPVFHMYYFPEYGPELIRKIAEAQLSGLSTGAITIIADGIPDSAMTDTQYENSIEPLMTAAQELWPQIRAEKAEAERKRKEEAANAALEKARANAAIQRAQDLDALEKLQKKLGLK